MRDVFGLHTASEMVRDLLSLTLKTPTRAQKPTTWRKDALFYPYYNTKEIPTDIVASQIPHVPDTVIVFNLYFCVSAFKFMLKMHVVCKQSC